MAKHQIEAARPKNRNYDIPPDEDDVDAIGVQNARKPQMPVGPAMRCVEPARIPTAEAPTQKVAVSEVGGRDPEHRPKSDPL